MIVGGLMNLTLLDYPEKVACTVFTKGCNFRCPFCHNATLVNDHDCQDLTVYEVLEFLKKRKPVLEGVCLTGGEPLIQSDVEEFLTTAKRIGYNVKLDTNGSFPDRLIALVENGLIDYCAMDVKNSKSRYAETVGTNVDIAAIEKSVAYLLSQDKIPFEFRTTVTANFHDEKSIEQLAEWIAGAPKYYLQKFVDSGDLIDGTVTGASDEQMHRYLEIAKKYVPAAELRGME